MNKVYITGLGCVTPLGNNIETFWEGLIAGRCGIAPIAAPHSDTLPIHVAGCTPSLPWLPPTRP